MITQKSTRDAKNKNGGKREMRGTESHRDGKRLFIAVHPKNILPTKNTGDRRGKQDDKFPVVGGWGALWRLIEKSNPDGPAPRSLPQVRKGKSGQGSGGHRTSAKGGKRKLH